MANRSKNAILGSIVHSLKFGELEIIELGLIIFSQDGIIEEVIDLAKNPKTREFLNSFGVLLNYSGKLIMPGFVDAHCHAPQYVFTGTGMDLPLLAWLEKYTFPCEAKFSEPDFARSAYTKSIQRHLKCGTTFASYFATIHNEASKVLVDVIHEVGQRAFVGKVSMDRNSPDFYIEKTTSGCEDAEVFVQYVLSQTTIGREFLRSIGSAVLGDEIIKRPRIGSSTVDEEPVGGNKRMRSVSHDFTPAVATGRGSEVVVIDDGESSSLYGGALRGGRGGATGVGGSSVVLPAVQTQFAENLKQALTHVIPVSPTSTRAIHCKTTISRFDFAASVMSSSSQESSIHKEGSVGSSLTASSSDSGSSHSRVSKTFVNSTLLNKVTTPLVMPCVTPRFVPTCTPAMMAHLGALSSRYGLPVQSHLSESPGEIEWVHSLHPDCSTYAAVYDKYGLLHENVYMAHCCHSSPEERALLARRGCGVVHCASSNFMLSSGVMDVRIFLNEGIKVALGTDVAGGYSPSMLDALRQCIVASRVKGFDHTREKEELEQHQHQNQHQTVKSGGDVEEAASTTGDTNESDSDVAKDNSSESSHQNATTTAAAASASSSSSTEPYRTLNYAEAFHLATVGGAEVLGMADVIGNFLIGKKLDCLVVDVKCEDSPIDTFEGESVEDHFEKFLFNGDDRNIACVFVDGRRVI